MEEIKKYCTKQSYDKGYDYYMRGKVKINNISENIVESQISGSSLYNVKIDLENLKESYCNCPYNWGGLCKHIVATYLDVIEEEGTLVKKQEIKDSKLDRVLKNVTLDEIKELIKYESQNNDKFRKKVIAYFSKDGRKVSEYKKEIKKLFQEAMGSYNFIRYGNNIDFFEYNKLLNLYESKKRYKENVKICLALTQTISENMHLVDDSDGYYGDNFRYYMEELAKNINLGEYESEKKRKYLDYFIDNYFENDPDFFTQYYQEGIIKLANSDEEKRYVMEIFEEKIPEEITEDFFEKYYQIQNILVYLKMLKDIDRIKFYKIIEKYYLENDKICYMYMDSLLQDGDIKKGIEIGEIGILKFNNSRKIRERLSPVYKNYDPDKYRENLFKIFLISCDMRYYQKLKSSCDNKEWNLYYKKLEDKLNKIILLEIYLKESNYPKAMELLIKLESLEEYKKNYKVLGEKFPDRYFREYVKLLDPFIQEKTGRSHYRRVVRYLRSLEKIKDKKIDFKEYIKKIRERYTRRPAFIDEISVF